MVMRQHGTHFSSILCYPPPQPTPLTLNAMLVWSECASLPDRICSAQAVVIDGYVYVGGGGADNNVTRCLVFRYAPLQDEWTTLPLSPVKWFGVGQLLGKLVLVGGVLRSADELTASIHTFENESQQWVTSIPPMPTARRAPAVASHSAAIIACGGKGEGNAVLAIVEVYNSETRQWYTVDPLPSPREWQSCVMIGDTWFLVGGYENATMISARMSVISTSITAILERTKSLNSNDTASLWESLPNVHYYISAAATVSGCLLALGGYRQDSRSGILHPQASLHAYCPGSSSWVHVGDLPSPRARCTTILLPTNELLIIGGWNVRGRISSVSKGTIQV